MQFSNVIRLSLRDYLHEWIMSGCFVLALAAVLTPLLVLFGLKFGIVSNMLEPLVSDPRNREIRPVGSGHFTAGWFRDMRDRSEVAFVLPRTRTIAATMRVHNEQADAGRIVPVELIPSGPGDPLLEETAPATHTRDTIVLSQSAARKLAASSGDTLSGSISRVFEGKRERVHFPLKVGGVAAAGAFERDGAFVAVDLLSAVEDFRDGRAVPAMDWSGQQPRNGDRTFAGFRLYARSIDDVGPLRDMLVADGLEVRTQAADIEIVRSLDDSLSVVYWIIALVGLSGYSLSLSASLWANVDRKRRELSVLRLVGFRTGSIVWFPVVQAACTGLLGGILAASLYFAIQETINDLFAASIESGQSICRLLPEHLAVSIGLTLLASVLASALGGLRAAWIEPSEGIREI